jgi:hypothetical protein
MLYSLMHPDPGSFRHLILAVVVASPLLTIAMLSIKILRSQTREHKLYYPMAILHGVSLRRRRSAARRYPPAAVTAFIAAGIALAFALSAMTGGRLNVATPLPLNNRVSFDRNGIDALAERGKVEALPDLSDYITHRAFQAGLLYNRKWQYPAEDTPVLMTRYQVEDGIVSDIKSPVVTFGTQWFDQAMTEAAQGGVSRLLIAQGAPVIVAAPGSIDSPRLVSADFLGIALFLLSPLLFMRLNLTTQYIYGMRNLLLRRKRQPA